MVGAADFRAISDRADAVRALVAEQRLVLVLDALDEAEDMASCAEAIAGFLRRRDTDCIVSCRSQAFSERNLRLPLRCSIELRPLDDEAILAYVSDLGPAHERLRAAIVGSKSLKELCRSPLILHLTVSTFARAVSGEGLPTHSIDEDTVIGLYFSKGLKLPKSNAPADVLTFLANITVLGGQGDNNPAEFVSIKSALMRSASVGRMPPRTSCAEEPMKNGNEIGFGA